MRRLYLQIYLAFVGILLLFGLLAALAWLFRPDSPEERRLFDGMETLLSSQLPTAGRPAVELWTALDQFARQFSADLSVYDADRRLLVSVGKPLPAPVAGQTRSGWARSRGGPTVAIHLPDGRWVMARHQQVEGDRHRWLGVLALLALAIAVGSYPVARRITGRLERLQSRLDDLGAGELSARVEVEGSDEVAELARRFNRAAERIEALVGAQRNMLASASHELRSPLARMRVAIELIEEEVRPEIRDRIARDIAELDELIEELLLASRLDVLEERAAIETVDLLALLAEEGSRVEAEVSGETSTIQGDGRMLRRLIRNLLENGRRHGAGSRIEASVRCKAEDVLLRVADHGPGVPAEHRQRIFDPFYRLPGIRESDEGGVGLGLALVQRIAQHHGGNASCLPRDGGGTVFEVQLPRSRPE